MISGKIAVIGDADSALAFKAVGAEAFVAESGAKAGETLDALVADGGYAVIFVTEALAAEIAEKTEKLKDRPYPCVVPVPSCTGSTGYGMYCIQKDIEKAIGASIADD